MTCRHWHTDGRSYRDACPSVHVWLLVPMWKSLAQRHTDMNKLKDGRALHGFLIAWPLCVCRVSVPCKVFQPNGINHVNSSYWDNNLLSRRLSIILISLLVDSTCDLLHCLWAGLGGRDARVEEGRQTSHRRPTQPGVRIQRDPQPRPGEQHPGFWDRASTGNTGLF